MNKALNNLLNWMDGNFNGDLEELKTKAFEKTKEEGMIEELWDEVGKQCIGHLYGSYRIRPNRNKSLKSNNVETDNYITKKQRQEMNDKHNNKVTVYDKLSQPYYVNDHYIDILNMTKEDCLIVASDYNERVMSNAFERDFFLNVADNLRDEQKVKDKFTLAELRNLRKKDEEKELEVV